MTSVSLQILVPRAAIVVDSDQHVLAVLFVACPVTERHWRVAIAVITILLVLVAASRLRCGD